MTKNLPCLLVFFSLLCFTTTHEEYMYHRPMTRRVQSNYGREALRDEQFVADQRPEYSHVHHNYGGSYDDSSHRDMDRINSGQDFGRNRDYNKDVGRHSQVDRGGSNYFNVDRGRSNQDDFGWHNHPAPRLDMGSLGHGRRPTVRGFVNPETRNLNNANNGRDVENKSGIDRTLQDFDDQESYSTVLGNRTTKEIKTSFKSRNCSFNLCDEVEDYPTDRILNIISRSPELKQYFSSQAISIIFNNRDKFDDEGETLCQTKTQTRFPKSAKNTKNMEKLLVNAGDYQQGVVYETCGSPGGACKFSDSFPINYVTSCRQKLVVRKLMILDEQSGNTVFDNFEIPSCCLCTVKLDTGY